MRIIEESLLDEITRRLVNELNPEQIILFGSHAWGTPDEDSDVDLFVIVSDSDQPPARRAVPAHRCLRDLGVPKDILVRTTDEVNRYRHVHASLECEVLEKGKVLWTKPN